MNVLLAVLAVLSIWDYPARQPQHERLRAQFVAATRQGDTATMQETCRKGVELLPDDPTWHYNLACSLAYYPRFEDEAFDELEKAIDLGFRDVAAIKGDADLKRLAKKARYEELVEYADKMRTRPLLTGPLVTVPATGVFGKSIVLGEQNLGWDFDYGAFVAHMRLAVASAGGNTGDLYMNRDGYHASINAASYPGLTEVRFDALGRTNRMDRTAPNTLFPYPTFGNCSMAYVGSQFWRSIPRALLTSESRKLKLMQKLYLSNQVWVFPAVEDTMPPGTNGDVFASIAPYWLTTQGKSWSDLPYLKAALEASRSFDTEVKRTLVAQGLLAPTIMTLVRKTLVGVTNETDYISAKAHPTALPPDGADVIRLAAAAARLKVAEIPPVVSVAVRTPPVKVKPNWPELTYATPQAWAFVLRAEENLRTFYIQADGAQQYAFVQTHGVCVDVRIDQLQANVARVTIRKKGMMPTNRIDIAVFGRNKGTGWGAPSYVSFAVMDPEAPYSDPVLTISGDPETKK